MTMKMFSRAGVFLLVCIVASVTLASRGADNASPAALSCSSIKNSTACLANKSCASCPEASLNYTTSICFQKNAATCCLGPKRGYACPPKVCPHNMSCCAPADCLRGGFVTCCGQGAQCCAGPYITQCCPKSFQCCGGTDYPTCCPITSKCCRSPNPRNPISICCDEKAQLNERLPSA